MRKIVLWLCWFVVAAFVCVIVVAAFHGSYAAIGIVAGAILAAAVIGILELS